jgi:predicted DNA-binding transcriptional regulator AlpA
VSDDKHLSPEELAHREGVPLQTVYGWNKTRTGPQFMRIGRHVRYRLADVVAWENSRLVDSR